MAEDNYDPFEEEYDTAHAPPRVNLGYKKTTKAQNRAPILEKLFNTQTLITLGKGSIVAFAILAYPIMAMQSHKLDDSPIVFDDSRHWEVQDIGVSSMLIARELDGPGWVSDRHPLHPQSRLTALPAWQNALLAALADHGRVVISELNGQRDQDLITAVRLLTPTEDQGMTDRLLAASQALAHYDDRVGASTAAKPSGRDALVAKLNLTGRWARARHSELVDIASPGDGWIASHQAVERVYGAKAQAHVAHNVLAANARTEATLIKQYDAQAAFDDAIAKWREAANLRPLFVSNQGGNGFIGANHPAIMAFRINEARLATEHVAALLAEPLADPEPAPEPGAQAAVLTPQ